MQVDSTPDYEPVPGAQVTHPRAISLDRATEIAREVRELVSTGQERVAWERMRYLHPADIGAIVAGLPRASRDVMLAVMSPETVVWILRQMNPVEAGRLGARIGSGMLSAVLRQVRPQVALATLRRLPFLAVRPQLVLETIRRIPTPRFGRTREVTAEKVEEALGELEPLAHAPDVAGALMVADFPMVDIDERVLEARERLRSLDENRTMFTHVLVRDEAEGFIGQVSMVDLALAENETPLRSMGTSVVAIVETDTPVEECARLQHHYSLTHLPVVEDGEVIGVILGESLVSAAVEEDTRQMMRVASVAGEVVDGPISGSIRTRLPWLTVNLGTTFLAAATVSLFESTLAQVVVLAAFLPVVAGQGGIGRHTDADAHRTSDGAWRAGRHRSVQNPGQGGHTWHSARHLAWPSGRGHSLLLEAEHRTRPGSRNCDVRKHDHRGHCRSRRAPAAETPGSRPGGRVCGGRHHVYGRVWFPAVSRHCQGFHWPATLGCRELPLTLVRRNANREIVREGLGKEPMRGFADAFEMRMPRCVARCCHPISGFVQYVLFVSERPCDSDVAASRVHSLAILRPGA